MGTLCLPFADRLFRRRHPEDPAQFSRSRDLACSASTPTHITRTAVITTSHVPRVDTIVQFAFPTYPEYKGRIWTGSLGEMPKDSFLFLKYEVFPWIPVKKEQRSME